MGSRDRLAQIRAQQNARGGGGGGQQNDYDYDQQQQQQYQQQSYPQQPRQAYGGEQGASSRSGGARGGAGAGGPQRGYSNDEDNRGTSRGPQRRSSSQPRQGQGLPSGPRPQGSGRRPTNPPALDVAGEQYRGQPAQNVYTNAQYQQRHDTSEYRRPQQQSQGQEPRDFNPMASSRQPTQYEPANPRITRARSISGGQRVSIDGGQGGQQGYGNPQDQYYYQQQPPPPPPPQQQRGPPPPPHQYQPPSQSRNRGQPPAPAYPDEQEDPYAYSDKGSTVNLMDRGEEYEMKQRGGGAPRKGSASKGKRGGPTIKMGDVPNEEMGEFFTEVSELQNALREANGAVSQIQSLHLRLLSLPSADDPQAVSITQTLSQQTQATRSFFASIKSRIMELEQGNANLRALIPVGQSLHKLSLQDVDVRQSQVSALKERFKDSIQKYAEVERDSRAKNRSRMERQVKIVNPSLNPDEVQNVVRQAEEGGGNLFSQALLQSNGQRSYAARGALREVESRAAELARIEQTLIELAQLFNDMAMMVEAQDVQIVQIEQQAEVVHKDVEKGLEDTKKAVVSARSARKLRWWCFGIILVILIIVAIVVVVEVVIPLINKNKGSSSSGSHTTTVTQSSTATPTAAAASASSNVFSISSNALYISGSGNGGFLPASTQRF